METLILAYIFVYFFTFNLMDETLKHFRHRVRFLFASS